MHDLLQVMAADFMLLVILWKASSYPLD